MPENIGKENFAEYGTFNITTTQDRFVEILIISLFGLNKRKKKQQLSRITNMFYLLSQKTERQHIQSVCSFKKMSLITYFMYLLMIPNLFPCFCSALRFPSACFLFVFAAKCPSQSVIVLRMHQPMRGCV